LKESSHKIFKLPLRFISISLLSSLHSLCAMLEIAFCVLLEIDSAIANSSCDCADSGASGEEIASGGVPPARVAACGCIATVGLTAGSVVDRDAG